MLVGSEVRELDSGIGYIEAPKFPKYVWLDGGNAKQMVWDTSSLSSFSSCPRYYNFQNLLGYKSKIYSTATGFGSAVHDGFEQLDMGRFMGRSKDESVYEAVKLVIIEHGEDLQKSDDKARNLEAALRAIVWRAEEYWEDTIKIATMPDGTPALEQRFEVPISDDGLRFSGRIDKVAELNNELYLVDTKTTKASLSDYYFNGFAPNNQIYAYLWAAKNILGLEIAGFIIDAVQTGVNFCRFNRAVFKVPSPIIKEWYDDAIHKLSLAKIYADKDYYPADFTACGNYGGCKYREICNESPDHRHKVVEELFEREVHEDLRNDDNVVELQPELEIEWIPEKD